MKQSLYADLNFSLPPTSTFQMQTTAMLREYDFFGKAYIISNDSIFFHAPMVYGLGHVYEQLIAK